MAKSFKADNKFNYDYDISGNGETKQSKGNRILRMIIAILFSGIVIWGITNMASATGTIYAEPKPYNQTMDGPPIANTQPNEKLVKREDIKLPERPVPSIYSISSILPIILPGSGDRGFWITNSSGIYVENDAQTDLNIPDTAIGTTIYAPVNMPAGNSCVETVTAHWYYTGMTGTAHGQGFWDHCGIDGSTGWQTFEFMDDAWKNKYVRNYNGEERYFTEVYNDSGCWTGLLYNFNEGRWETKISPVCSSSGYSYGWTMWESHYLMDQAKVCPSFPNIRASGIKILTNNGWIYLDTNSNLGPYGLCWENGIYQLAGISSDWTAMTLLSNNDTAIRVTSPNGTEIWPRGTTRMIQWNYTGSPGSFVNITLMKGGVFNRTINSSVPIGSNYSGSYSWLINSTQTPGTNYKVRITSTTNAVYNDTSDNNFTIVAIGTISGTVRSG